MKKFFKGFVYAFFGIREGFKERNFRFHIFATFVVVVSGIVFEISKLEWIIVGILISLVMSAELVNTAIEDLSNIIRDKCGVPYEFMGRAKNIAAGVVLVLAICAATIGLTIFLPRILNF